MNATSTSICQSSAALIANKQPYYLQLCFYLQAFRNTEPKPNQRIYLSGFFPGVGA